MPPVHAPGVTVAPVHRRVFVPHDGAGAFTEPFVTPHEAPVFEATPRMLYSEPFGVDVLQSLIDEPMTAEPSAGPEQSDVEKAS